MVATSLARWGIVHIIMDTMEDTGMEDTDITGVDTVVGTECTDQ